MNCVLAVFPREMHATKDGQVPLTTANLCANHLEECAGRIPSQVGRAKNKKGFSGDWV